MELLYLTVFIALVCFINVNGKTLNQLSVDSKPTVLNDADPSIYKDCGHLLKSGYNVSGVHRLHMNISYPFLIWCEFQDGNAFNVIQRRMNGDVSFEQPLSLYMSGFGNVQSDYWIGLPHINYLTMQQNNKVLTIHMQDWGGINQNARYNDFRVLPEANQFTMYAAGYSGTLPDDFGYSSGRTFKTYDYPDENNCASNQRAGWWYNYCAYALLNGKYYLGGSYKPVSSYYDGIYWKDWRGYDYSLKFASMVLSTS